MSHTQIELTALQPPEAIAKTTNSLRRSSRASTNRPSYDGTADVQSLHILERTDTVTSKSRTTVIIACVTLITAISTLLNGLTTVALPAMAKELDIPKPLQLWPSSIQALTNGCTLLIAGSVSDALGSRFMYLVGCVLQAGFVLGCGLSKTSTQIILFRGLSGVALSFCLPSAVAIITRSFVGKRRDFAFAAMGGGQPIGFAVGLTVGGFLTDGIGWQWGFYLAAVFDAAIFAVALFGLPKSIDSPLEGQGAADLTWRQKWMLIKHDIDWVGALIASVSLAALSYVFVTITGTNASIAQPESIVLLVVAFGLIPVFIWWVGRREKLNKPAIIPAIETMLTFFFQDVQELSATKSSLYFLPAPVSGALSNIVIGFIVHRISANWLVLGGCTISAFGPFVMTFAKVNSSYWSHAFLSNAFNPVGADSLYVVANLLITSVFPPRTHGLAGGVFNTVAQVGKSVGIALVAVIASAVTENSDYENKKSPAALLAGYNATFWFCFAQILATVVIAFFGLRKAGKVGHKKD
ncbi:uncharacterized protein LTR77_006353 [Saxophila tyrrhenica]|uniref:Major facilitator superfamily (MFS) profile domain-containing protein n=1 Tax=Saxophila tyrrhenica TaxID=1690608 RepID=A0AAV9PB40_9PEZI|nr:hypothetical protein LTR77_006353 [Saxophila tyrrhenica]